jgi:hypothetical protein
LQELPSVSTSPATSLSKPPVGGAIGLGVIERVVVIKTVLNIEPLAGKVVNFVVNIALRQPRWDASTHCCYEETPVLIKVIRASLKISQQFACAG